MEHYQLENDLTLFYAKANTFPEGVMDAYQRLHEWVKTPDTRNIYGISYFIPGGIEYLAAAVEEYPGEGAVLGCETYLLPAGTYISEYVEDFRTDMGVFTRIFNEMTSRPDIDPQGCCVEMYIGEHSVRCMVRLKDTVQ